MKVTVLEVGPYGPTKVLLEDANGIQSRELRSVRLGAIAAANGVTAPPLPQLKRPADWHLGDDFYADVAKVYTWAVANMVPPCKFVAEHARVSRNTAAQWIHRARKRGMLPPTVGGRIRA